MNISYVTTYDALDIHNWSGLGYMIAKSLEEQNNELDYIGNLKANASPAMYLKKIAGKVSGKSFEFEREPFIAQQYARQIQTQIKDKSDVIFCPGTIPISLLDTQKPKVIYTDATFAGMLGFYDNFSRLSNETLEHGHYLEKRALDSSKLAIYSSDWAAKTAIDHYNIDQDKVKVVPFGANIESNRNLDDIKNIVIGRSTRECHLLFMAVDWHRKGGDLAIRIAEKLNLLGLKTTLHIAGIKQIPVKELPPFIVNHGFISKSNEEGRKKIDMLLSMSHFLLLPTIADCTPVVFSEANSFGLPCISTDIGGIPTIVRPQVNGMLFSSSSNEDSYASYIHSTFTDGELYKELSLSSFNEFEKRLNWTVAGKEITRLLKSL
jgi:glycosyltransferase involved in cell wall biosynthesis